MNIYQYISIIYQYIHNSVHAVITYHTFSYTSDDIIVEDIEFGITNYCYKVYDKQQENAAVFLKHSKDFIKGWGSIPLTSERLQFEYEGLLAFSKYSGEFIPKVLVYDGVSKYLGKFIELNYFKLIKVCMCKNCSK